MKRILLAFLRWGLAPALAAALALWLQGLWFEARLERLKKELSAQVDNSAASMLDYIDNRQAWEQGRVKARAAGSKASPLEIYGLELPPSEPEAAEPRLMSDPPAVARLVKRLAEGQRLVAELDECSFAPKALDALLEQARLWEEQALKELAALGKGLEKELLKPRAATAVPVLAGACDLKAARARGELDAKVKNLREIRESLRQR